ncbi:hypothetical protein NWF32_11185 [Pseudomonas qingdaonensis]|nr:hypothetical protein [Pseudomonas qingdaonensis]
MRLMICLAGLLLAVPLQRKLDSSDSAPASQEKLLPIFPNDDPQPPRITKTAAENKLQKQKEPQSAALRVKIGKFRQKH